MNLKYHIDNKEQATIIALSGKISSDQDIELAQQELNKLFGEGKSRLIFDLEKLTHTNSSGIAFLMRTLTKCRIMGGDMVLTGVIGNVQKVFEITKLVEVYTIFNSKEEALNFYLHSV